QIKLVESGDLRSLGDFLHLSCYTSGFNLSSYKIICVRQYSGKGLEWVAHINTSSSNSYSDKVKGHFTSLYGAAPASHMETSAGPCMAWVQGTCKNVSFR
uniref:Uncharacterized protein n=1 Tax=Naja naja TaxID=35670 RepID=A0A8C7DSA3_NAJNA